jgi:hypothetical protein
MADEIEQKSTSEFNDMSVFSFGYTILFGSVWAIKLLCNAILGKKFFKNNVGVLTSIITSQCFDADIEMFFH